MAEGYVRNETNLIEPQDDSEYRRILAVREKAKRNNDIAERVSEIEYEMRDIKAALHHIIERLDK